MLSIAVTMMTSLMLITVLLISVFKLYWRSIFSLFLIMFSTKVSFFKLYFIILNDIDVVKIEKNENIKRDIYDECKEVDMNSLND